MFQFLLKRVGWGLLTLWAVFTISFFLMRAAPGGPFDEERKVPPEIEKNLNAKFHLDEPLYKQYFMVLGSVAMLDFLPSYKLEDYHTNEIIRQGFPVSASLGIFAMTFALVFGTTAGVIAAVRRNTGFDYSFMAAATLGIAVPNFVLASSAVVLFVFYIPLLPAGGWGEIRQILLPALCLGAPFAGYIARLTRTGMLDVLSLDYIRTAYAKGLSSRRVVLRHALRGALLPVVSYIGPATAAVLTGSLVLERIFALPGMGSHFIEAALQRDYSVAMGMVLVYTFLLFVMNTLVDLSYSIIDPRVKLNS